MSRLSRSPWRLFSNSMVTMLEALRTPWKPSGDYNIRPDLLISDVVMPQLSGIDLAIRVKEQCPACKVLLFSGQAQTADLLEVARIQGHDFELLAKPIHPADLLARIKDEDVLVQA